jgi:murein DD-endopeptidase MepM/ murein hydrolase activator NlpD
MRRIGLLPLVAVLLVGSSVTSVGAEQSPARAGRDAARARRARLASRLDTLRASDREIGAAVAALGSQVDAQAGVVRGAESAVAAADVAVAAAEARLRAAEARLRRLRAAMARRAVDAYMHPGQGVVAEVLGSRTLAEASRRRTLLRHVMGDERDLADELREAREDAGTQRDDLKRARTRAAERRAAASARLAALRDTRAQQVRVRAALALRIAEYTEEADQVAAIEAVLSDTIRREEAQAAARLAWLRAARPPPPAPRRAPVAAPTPPTGPRPAAPPSRSGLLWPVNGRVTSGFGMRWGRMHQGIDISASTGTPIRAARAGVVITAGTMGGYGNVVIVSHGGGFSTLYAHQSRLGCREGQEVEPGQVIGYVGSTGHSTGPHLHFETRVDGVARDPMHYL